MCEKESVRPPKIGRTRDVREIKERVVPFHIRSLKIGFCAEHEPFIPLPVVTDLAATDEPVRSMRAEIGPDHAGHRAGNVG